MGRSIQKHKLQAQTARCHTDRVVHVATGSQVLLDGDPATGLVDLEVVDSKTLACQPVPDVSLFQNHTVTLFSGTHFRPSTQSTERHFGSAAPTECFPE